MDDSISRQAAIEIIKKYCENGCDIAEDNWCPSCQREQFIKLLEALPSAQHEPCDDAVSRVDVLECFSDLYDTFEDCSKGIVNELHRKFEDLRTLPSVTPKSQEYKTDHGYMWICPDCGLVAHSDFKKCVRCGHKREE